MRKQIIFCLETNTKADTDTLYIKDTLKEFYKDADYIISTEFIRMGSKSKYKSAKITKKIKEYQEPFLGEKYVIYCVDTDKTNAIPEDVKLLNDIKLYCLANKYDFVWFCEDVEDVYLGKKVSDKEKVAEAAKFHNNGLIKDIKRAKLSAKTEKRKYSNILAVLDQYYEKKVGRK